MIGSLPYRALRAFAIRIRGTIESVATPDPVVAITFDDGPDPEITPRVIDLLERYDARATFFPLGESAKRYPDLVEAVAAAGHALGNHSWDHPSFPAIPRAERRRQIRECARALAPHGVRLFRPPFGHQTAATFMDALLLGYQVVTWSVIANDWLGRAGRSIAEEVEPRVAPGKIVLFHDGVGPIGREHPRSRQATLDAVEHLLDRLRSRFRFVTLPDLLRHGRPVRTDWARQGSADFFRTLYEPGGAPWRYRDLAQDPKRDHPHME